ncbi:efflux transporter, outer membrane factor lipoprotein, NodT family [Achromobacter piechaudii ATCC 43553]|uniref:Efflux transporter, outer membrane factor lipoprotein, NodT family n=2 Tax=Achromobacter piechaudii TaxID=72556 RepID=D4XE62_9BURK|nr:efflux transporter, outer membrane factor lipoprotein, NodT family [Achromobacter piechaudii ATCC 43553]
MIVMMHMAFPRSLGALLLTAALAGCSMAPVYQRPHAPIPAQFPDATASAGGNAAQSAAATLDWQSFVTDEALRQLVALSLDNNRDLRQAVLNIEAARAQYRIERADRLPGINAQGSGTRQRVPGDLNTTGQSAVQSSYQAGIGLTSFEVDLFGRVRSLSDAALQTYLATEETAHATRISLVAEVIQAYLTRDSAMRRLQVTEQTLASREASLNLIVKRRQAGTATALDYQEALGLTEQARAERERMAREVRQAGNALGLLVGVDDLRPYLPSQLAASPVLLQDIAAGAPSELLERRPDILAAEHELRSRNASIGAARAAFFPSITLTGLYGSSSADLSDLFGGGQRAWSFMPQITLPIFSGGRNVANLDLATVRKDIAVAKYEATIQGAFREVADALAATETLQREEASRRALAESSRQAMLLSEARYRGGVDSHLRYLDAQRSAFTDQLTYIDVSTQRQIALATLFKALGGGWPGVQSPQAMADGAATGAAASASPAAR